MYTYNFKEKISVEEILSRLVCKWEHNIKIDTFLSEAMRSFIVFSGASEYAAAVHLFGGSINVVKRQDVTGRTHTSSPTDLLVYYFYFILFCE
jgi:hypothetical protein